MPKKKLDRFVFLWRHEQGCKMFNEITPESYYYLKDLKHVYYVCHGYFMGRKIKHYWLTMNPTRHFKIQNGVVFFLNHSGDKVVKKQGAMVGLDILFMAMSLGWIAIGQDNSNSLWQYGQVF